jgi:hypothetical protein
VTWESAVSAGTDSDGISIQARRYDDAGVALAGVARGTTPVANKSNMPAYGRQPLSRTPASLFSLYRTWRRM